MSATKSDKEMTEALRAAYPAQEPSDDLRRRVATLAAAADARRQERDRGRDRWRRGAGLGLAFAGTAAALAASVVLTPTLVTARELYRVQTALDGVTSMHLIRHEVRPDGSRVRSEEWHRDGMVREEGESPRKVTLFAEGRLWSYWPERNKVTVQRRSQFYQYGASGHTMAAWRKDLTRWGWGARLRTLGETVWQGRPHTRVRIDHREPAGLVRMDLLVDKQTDLPMRCEISLDRDGGGKTTPQGTMELRYNEPLPASLFRPNFPKSATLVNLDTAREDLHRRMERPIATQKAGERTIAIRDLQVNEDGDVFLLYTAGKVLDDIWTPHYDPSIKGRWFSDRKRDWTVTLTDEFGTNYIHRPIEFDYAKPRATRFVFGEEKVEGDWWTPLSKPERPWRPRRFTLTFHCAANNLHGAELYGLDDHARGTKEVPFSEETRFALTHSQPDTDLVPDYWTFLTSDWEDGMAARNIRMRSALSRGDSLWGDPKTEDLSAALYWYQEYRRAGQEDPKYRPAGEAYSFTLRLARVLARLGRTEEARAELARALDSDGARGTSDRAMYWVEAARVYRDMGDETAATGAIVRAISETRDPKFRAWLRQNGAKIH